MGNNNSKIILHIQKYLLEYDYIFKKNVFTEHLRWLLLTLSNRLDFL